LSGVQGMAGLTAVLKAWTFEDETTLKSLKLFKQRLVGKCLRKRGWIFSRDDDQVDQLLKALLFANAAGDEQATKVVC
jgi:hypothetical protein